MLSVALYLFLIAFSSLAGPQTSLAGDAFGPTETPEVPAGAVEIKPGDDINAVIQAHPAGSAFLLKAGTYRLQSVVLREDDVLVGEYGAELNGARLIDLDREAAREGDKWVLLNQTQQGETFDECFDEFPTCKYPEQVFIDDAPLRQVASRREVLPGTFYFDYGADKIYLAEDPTGKKVEVSITEQAIEGAPGAVVRNLRVTKYAQTGDWVVVRMLPGMTAEYNDISFNNGVGLGLEDNTVARHNRVTYSGRIGVKAVFTENTLLEHNEIAYNNTKGYSYNWEAGGSKFWATRTLTIRDNYVHHNFGPGLWSDNDNQGILYEGNLVTDNTANGIFHEISGAAVIRNNNINYNGMRGIDVANSYDTEVYGNVLRGNLTSLWAGNACRSEAGEFQVKNVQFYDNVVYQDAHIAGNEAWPFGKAAGFFAERECDKWQTPHKAWFSEMNNRWYDNTYHLSSLPEDARPLFYWQEGEIALEAWKSYGLQ